MQHPFTLKQLIIILLRFSFDQNFGLEIDSACRVLSSLKNLSLNSALVKFTLNINCLRLFSLFLYVSNKKNPNFKKM